MSPGCAPVAGPYELNRVDPVMMIVWQPKPHTGREAAEVLVRIPSILTKAVNPQDSRTPLSCLDRLAEAS